MLTTSIPRGTRRGWIGGETACGRHRHVARVSADDFRVYADTSGRCGTTHQSGVRFFVHDRIVDAVVGHRPAKCALPRSSFSVDSKLSIFLDLDPYVISFIGRRITFTTRLRPRGITARSTASATSSAV